MNAFDSLRREFATPLNTLQGEVTRLVKRYRSSADLAGEPGAERPAWIPDVDLVETDTAVEVWADLPGVDPNALELSVTGRELIVAGRKDREAAAFGGREFAVERPAGAFRRRVELPADVDVEGIEAQVRAGVLHVRLPKNPDVQPRSIPIRVG